MNPPGPTDDPSTDPGIPESPARVIEVHLKQPPIAVEKASPGKWDERCERGLKAVKVVWEGLKVLAVALLVLVISANWSPIRQFLTSKFGQVVAVRFGGTEIRFAEESRKQATDELKALISTNNPATNWARLSPQFDAALKRLERSQPVVNGSSVLWVDDHPLRNESLIRLLESYGIRVWLALNNEEALTLAKRVPVDLVLSDIGRDAGNESRRTGLDLPGKLFKAGFDWPVIYFVAQYDRWQEAIPPGAQAETRELPELIHLVCEHLERAYYLRVFAGRE